MDYEKEYKKALERAKRLHSEPTGGTERIVCEQIFPELAESEDEKIRKELIEHIKANCETGFVLFQKFSPDDVIAWLEKQEQVKESPISQHENKTCKENDDSLTGEDEKIREALIKETEGSEERLFETVTNEEFIAWLKKQGSQILANSEKTCKDEQKSTDKVEPKFHEGEWICSSLLETACIIGVNDSNYQLEYIGGEQDFSSIDYVNNAYDKWTIHDAKDGDVLTSGEVVFIFKVIYGVWLNCHCSAHKDESFNADSYDLLTDKYFGEVQPATKEQCDFLFQKMKEAGYEWDAKKKELKKIKQRPTWSETDNFMYNRIKNLLTDISIAPESRNSLFDWLKSLKQRIGG